MTHDIGPLAKLHRAESHLNAMKKVVQLFVDSEPYVFEFDSNTEQTEHVLRAYFKHALPDDLGLVTGDFAHNARSALDLLVHSISAVTSTAKEWRKLQFPIFSYLDGYLERKPSYLRGVSSKHCEIIEALQPYHRGQEEALNDPLWLLHELNNSDKHRVIQVVTAFGHLESVAFGAGMIGKDPWMLSGQGASISSSWCKFDVVNDGVISEDGAAVAKFQIKAPKPADMHPKAVVKVQFGEGCEQVQGRPVLETLTLIHDRVRDIVGQF